MDIKQAQEEISSWGRQTFGPCDPGKIATRMNVEMAELLVGFDEYRRLENLAQMAFETDSPEVAEFEAYKKFLGKECADIFVMLVQVAAAIDVDLDQYQQDKMIINRNRVWATGANGKVQHVDANHDHIFTRQIEDPMSVCIICGATK